MSSDTLHLRIQSADIPRDVKPEVESVLTELAPLVGRLRDQRQAWELATDGSWQRARPEGNRDSFDGLGTHQLLMNLAYQRAHVSVERKDTTSNV